MVDIDVLVIGAGVVGLAVARALALAGREVVVAERHGLIGHETSSRNSEVVHAGIYYAPGSAKARACVLGREMLASYCASRGVGFRRIGKLIVAADEAEVARLATIRENAARNGVELHPLSGAEARAMEPALACAAALHSPLTAIVDSHALMLALQGDLEASGGQIAFHTEVASLDGAGATLADGSHVTVGHTVVCGGLAATDLLPGAGLATRYAKGNYFRLAQGRAPFSRLIYPVPVEGGPLSGGLGVHLTLDLAGQARFGPDVEWVETLDYGVDPDRAKAFERSIRRFWPALPNGALVPDYAGIRPKVADDFTLLGKAQHGLANVTALVGIESPGLTSCLWLGEWVAEVVRG